MKKVNQSDNIIKRCFIGLIPQKEKAMHTSLVWSVLKYAAPQWSPYYPKDIDVLESVQKSWLSLTVGQIDMSSPNTRRLEVDLVEVYKYVKDFFKGGYPGLFTHALSCSAAKLGR